MSNQVWQYTTRGRLSTTIEQASRPIPAPKDGEIVLKLKAAALNPVEEQLAQESDFMLKFMGWPPMGTPVVPCSDFSGVVHSVGSGVSMWKVGDEVFGVKFLSTEGTLQQYISVPASSPLARRPHSLTHASAAALPLVYSTVYTALINYGKLPFHPCPSEVGKRSVLILGGSSGTGSVGIQLAKKMGLKVVTTCSTKSVALVENLGADEVIDYTSQHVLTAALHSPHAPFAVILDCVGGTELIPSLEHLILNDPKSPELGIYVTIVGDKTSRDAMGGAITNYLYPSQAIRTFRGKLNDLLPWYFPFKSWLANRRYACILMQPTAEMMDTVPEFMESAGEVLIQGEYKWKDARKAFEQLESGRSKGKVVVEIPE